MAELADSEFFNPSSWDMSPEEPERERGNTIHDVIPSIVEDGRAYQGYFPSAYSLPNDGEEQDRQDLLHANYLMILSGKLAGAPIDNPRNVLDIGTGTGIWAQEFAEQYPDALVTGTDLSLIQPYPRTPNCQFILENSETADWIYQEPYDYVHLRSIGPCFQDVRTVIAKAYDAMAPGGYIEFLDGFWELYSFDGSIEGTDIQRWIKLVVQSASAMGQDMTKVKHIKKYLVEAGFEDVVERIYPSAFGPWMRDPQMKQMSRYAGSALITSLRSYRKVLKAGGLSPEEIDDLIAGAKRDVEDLRIHSFMLIYNIYGRKPEPPQDEPSKKRRRN